MKKAHILKANKRREIPHHLIFYDCESYPEKVAEDVEKHRLRLGWAVYVRVKGNKKPLRFYEKWKKFKSREEFWDFVLSHAKDKKKLYLIAHNQNFDFIILNGFKELEKRGWKLETWIIDANLFYVRFRKEGKTIVVIDTLNLFKFSVKALGEAVGLEKLKVDFNKASERELSVYCRRDVEIIKEMFLSYLKFLVEHNLGNFKWTIASQAFTAFKHRFMRHKIYIHDNWEVIELERKTYRGGRCEAFFLGEIRGNVYDLDVNSLYPFVMIKHEYPTKLIKHGKSLSIEALKRFLSKYCVIAHVLIKTPEPVFGVKRERLIFPVGQFHAYLCTNELKYALEKGYIQKVYEYAVYEKAPIFKEYVQFFYDLKAYYSKTGDKVRRTLTKLFMNSLYGKFGQHNENFIELDNEGCGDYRVEIFYNERTKERALIINLGEKRYLKVKGHSEAMDSFVAIAAEVTANARMHLWYLMQKAGRENVYYCDTDSVFVNENGFKRLKDEIDDYELGKLKLERVGTRLEIRNVKDYTIDNITKLKGVRKDSVKIGENQYKTYRFLKFRSLLRKGSIDAPMVEYYVKTLKREYRKGIVGKDGWVMPFSLFESP